MATHYSSNCQSQCRQRPPICQRPMSWLGRMPRKGLIEVNIWAYALLPPRLSVMMETVPPLYTTSAGLRQSPGQGTGGGSACLLKTSKITPEFRYSYLYQRFTGHWNEHCAIVDRMLWYANRHQEWGGSNGKRLMEEKSKQFSPPTHSFATNLKLYCGGNEETKICRHWPSL